MLFLKADSDRSIVLRTQLRHFGTNTG